MTWHELHKRFDPLLAIRGSDHASWRAERKASPAGRIVRTLAALEGTSGTKWLLVGTVGTGKTTELFRIAEARARDDFVILVDLADHFDKVVGDPEGLQRVEPWEVVFVAALALLRAASEQLGEDLPAERVALEEAWKRAAGRASDSRAAPAIDLAKLVGSVAVAVSSMLGGPSLAPLAAISGAVWNAPIGVKRDRVLLDQEEEARTLLNCFNRIAGGIQSRTKRVLLVLDGLDRLRDRDHAERLFVQSSLFGRLATSLVMTAPMGFRHSLTPRGIAEHDIQTLVLENEPVLDRDAPDDPRREGAGVAFFLQVFKLRVADLGRVLLADRHVHQLAYYSGGRAREFMRLVRQVALEHIFENADASRDELIDRVLREHRLGIERGLHVSHIDILRSVKNDPLHRCPDGDLVWELVRSEVLLPYPDGSPWYYPHPVLLLGRLLE
jgi:hypothetical protein